MTDSKPIIQFYTIVRNRFLEIEAAKKPLSLPANKDKPVQLSDLKFTYRVYDGPEYTVQEMTLAEAAEKRRHTRVERIA